MDEKTIEEVKKIVEKVRQKHGIDLEKVIVFGSRAGENYRDESEVDILIVSSDFFDHSRNKRPKPFYKVWDYEHLPVPEFICLAPEEFDKKKKKKPNIVRTAVQTGVKVKSKEGESVQSSLGSPAYTGTQVNYYFVCTRKLWDFSNDLSMEQNSVSVSIGKQIHEQSYKREKKEVMIDNRIAVDFIGDQGVINEVKKSNSIEQAHLFQVLYYIYYLRQKGVKNVKGVIRYPKLRDKMEVHLTEESKSNWSMS